MKDEIKEINLSEMLFNRDERLLDYITNLQQENEEWGMIFDTFSSRPYAHRYLEEKRKELGNDKIIGLDSEMIYKDYYDYKSRCEKASECIKKDTRWFDSEYASIYGELCDCAGAKGDRLEVMVNPSNALNILQNGSENE